MNAFLKKEWMEWNRTGRSWILMLVFVLFGIMNPALAKLTISEERRVWKECRL